MLAYLGLACGHTTVHEAVRDDLLRAAVETALDTELVPAVPAADGLSAVEDAQDSLRRFANSAVPHRLAQVGAGGSTKLPQRLSAVVESCVATGRAPTWSAAVVAAWAHAVGRGDVDDDRAADVRAALDRPAPDRARALPAVSGLTRGGAWLPFDDLDAVGDEVWHDILDVNLVGAFRCARAFAPALRQAGGAIVNIASISAYRGLGSSLPYGVSKAALLQLTRSLAVALGPEVRVNSVSPGTVATRWQLDHHGDEAFDQLTARERETAPLARTTQPEDVAAAVLGLLEADMVTGVDVVVDAGKHLMY